MPTSNTNSPKITNILVDVEAKIRGNSMRAIRARVKRESDTIDVTASTFFTLFADKVLNTSGNPSLGIYTPKYAPYTDGYAQKKSEQAPGRGWFSFSGDLESDVRSLRGETSNILGRSSSWIEMSNTGLNPGFKVASNGAILNLKTNKFASYRESLKDFKVKVVHKPFDKLSGTLKPKTLEKQVFSGTYDSIYKKLANVGGKGRTYRSGFYSYMNWWIQVYLKGKL